MLKGWKFKKISVQIWNSVIISLDQIYKQYSSPENSIVNLSIIVHHKFYMSQTNIIKALKQTENTNYCLKTIIQLLFTRWIVISYSELLSICKMQLGHTFQIVLTLWQPLLRLSYYINYKCRVTLADMPCLDYHHEEELRIYWKLKRQDLAI